MPKMELHDAYLIIADISGYTNFVKLHKASVLHAEEIVSELMEALIDTIEQPLILNKLEGDAAFFYAKAGLIEPPQSRSRKECCFFLMPSRINKMP